MLAELLQFLFSGLTVGATYALAAVVVEKLAIRPAQHAEVVTLIIITLGVSLVLRGAIQMWRGTETHALP